MAGAFVLPAGGGRALAAPADLVPRTVVMSAYGPEWSAFRAALTDAHAETIADVTYLVGRLRGRDVVLFRSGVSMVNAAMSLQAAIDRFDVERIVFSGIAGGIDPALSVGDVVVPERWSEYLESVFARETRGGYSPPAFLGPTLPDYGMIFPLPVEIAHPGREDPERREWFDADPRMLRIARDAAARTQLKACAGPGRCLAHPPRIVVGGNGVSGTAFVDNAAFRAWVFATFHAEAVDNESAAVAHVAYANHKPFIVFRSLSDLAGGDAGRNTMDVFERLASDNSAALVLAFLAALGR